MEALFYEKMDNSDVKCLLCPRGCVILPQKAGFCRVRANDGGSLTLPYYGMLSSVALDPIEKKPLYRYRPGSKVLSVGGYSCNMRCAWCQNHEITMNKPDMRFYPPDVIAGLALKFIENGNIGVAYTYNEPFIHYEYVLDCAKKVKDAGLCNVLVTNGYINVAPLKEILPFIDACNIDLKGFSEDFYKNIAGGLSDVLETIAIAAKACQVEVTTLIIPGENDDPGMINEMSKRIAEINNEIPLHLTRFYPRYKMADKSPTEHKSILELKRLADRYLKYVYHGNF